MAKRALDMAEADPKGLLRESYRIAGISAEECRSIFLDWALSLPSGADPRPAMRAALAAYGAALPEHPMTEVLTTGLAAPEGHGQRRGGRAGRLQPK